MAGLFRDQGQQHQPQLVAIIKAPPPAKAAAIVSMAPAMAEGQTRPGNDHRGPRNSCNLLIFVISVMPHIVFSLL